MPLPLLSNKKKDDKNICLLFWCVSSERCWNVASVLEAKTDEQWHNWDRELSSLWIHSITRTSIYLLCHLTRRELLRQLQGRWIKFHHIVCRETARADDLFKCLCAEYLWEINLYSTICWQFLALSGGNGVKDISRCGPVALFDLLSLQPRKKSLV